MVRTRYAHVTDCWPSHGCSNHGVLPTLPEPTQAYKPLLCCGCNHARAPTTPLPYLHVPVHATSSTLSQHPPTHRSLLPAHANRNNAGGVCVCARAHTCTLHAPPTISANKIASHQHPSTFEHTHTHARASLSRETTQGFCHLHASSNPSVYVRFLQCCLSHATVHVQPR